MRKQLYKIRFDKENKFYDVIEIYTDEVVNRRENYQDALNLVRFYERGGGFFGFTPKFIINK